MKNPPEVRRPDWLEKALPEAIKSLQLAPDGPEGHMRSM